MALENENFTRQTERDGSSSDFFQRVYTKNRLFKLHLENVYRILGSKNFRSRHLHLFLSYKYNFAANFSRIFLRIQPRDIELNKSWDFDAVESDVEKYSPV